MLDGDVFQFTSNSPRIQSVFPAVLIMDVYNIDLRTSRDKTDYRQRDIAKGLSIDMRMSERNGNRRTKPFRRFQLTIPTRHFRGRLQQGQTQANPPHRFCRIKRIERLFLFPAAHPLSIITDLKRKQIGLRILDDRYCNRAATGPYGVFRDIEDMF